MMRAMVFWAVAVGLVAAAACSSLLATTLLLAVIVSVEAMRRAVQGVQQWADTVIEQLQQIRLALEAQSSAGRAAVHWSGCSTVGEWRWLSCMQLSDFKVDGVAQSPGSGKGEGVPVHAAVSIKGR